jgi:hypothetical protein
MATEAQVVWRKANRDRLLQEKREWNKKHAQRKQDQERDRREGYRTTLLNRYGTSCACCHESDRTVLVIDHINGGGNKEREKFGSGTSFHRILIKRGMPDGYRTLCHNCNQCVFSHGQCVHLGPHIKTGGPRYEYMRKRRYEAKLAAFRAYSNDLSCRLCNESHVEFLCLDHVDGGGKRHRKEVGRGSGFYGWLSNNNYPPGFQLLCLNCNFRKG